MPEINQDLHRVAVDPSQVRGSKGEVLGQPRRGPPNHQSKKHIATQESQEAPATEPYTRQGVEDHLCLMRH